MASRSAGREREFRVKAIPSFLYFRRAREEQGQM
jgi:hypothetical protein